jgi:hypothetical protein
MIVRTPFIELDLQEKYRSPLNLSAPDTIKINYNTKCYRFYESKDNTLIVNVSMKMNDGMKLINPSLEPNVMAPLYEEERDSCHPSCDMDKLFISLNSEEIFIDIDTLDVSGNESKSIIHKGTQVRKNISYSDYAVLANNLVVISIEKSQDTNNIQLIHFDEAIMQTKTLTAYDYEQILQPIPDIKFIKDFTPTWKKSKISKNYSPFSF